MNKTFEVDQINRFLLWQQKNTNIDKKINNTQMVCVVHIFNRNSKTSDRMKKNIDVLTKPAMFCGMIFRQKMP